MDTSYRFLSDSEPTDEQLKGLMKAVLSDVKERAAKADQQFKALQAKQIQEAKEKWGKKDGDGKV